jgi:hypothetical protein
MPHARAAGLPASTRARPRTEPAPERSPCTNSHRTGWEPSPTEPAHATLPALARAAGPTGWLIAPPTALAEPRGPPVVRPGSAGEARRCCAKPRQNPTGRPQAGAGSRESS